jgi:hypothetical protein
MDILNKIHTFCPLNEIINFSFVKKGNTYKGHSDDQRNTIEEIFRDVRYILYLKIMKRYN